VGGHRDSSIRWSIQADDLEFHEVERRLAGLVPPRPLRAVTHLESWTGGQANAHLWSAVDDVLQEQADPFDPKQRNRIVVPERYTDLEAREGRRRGGAQ
jgi:hypothetical protein